MKFNRHVIRATGFFLILCFALSISACTESPIVITGQQSTDPLCGSVPTNSNTYFDCGVTSSDISLSSAPESTAKTIPFFIGTWEYITAIPNDIPGAGTQYSANIYSYMLGEDGTVSTYSGWPNSDIAVLYEGVYEIVEADEYSCVLDMILEQTFLLSENMTNTATNDTYHVTLSIYLYGPSYRAEIQQLQGESIYTVQEISKPFWYTKVND